MRLISVLKFYPKNVKIALIDNGVTIYKGLAKNVTREYLVKRVKDIEPIIDEHNKVVIVMNLKERNC